MEKKKSIYPPLLLTAVLLLTAGSAMAARRCGNCGHTPVPYPLSTGPNCGDQSYKIRCHSGTLRLDALYGSSYVITSISPETQRLVIRPASFTGNNTCITTDILSEGIHLHSSLPFKITGSNTIIYLNCANRMHRSPFDCTNTSICHTYIGESPELSACEKAHRVCCYFRTGAFHTSHKLSVRQKSCSAYRSFVNLDTSLPVSKWPAPGMEIEWASPREPICRTQADCDEGFYSICALDPHHAGGQRRCFCKAGLRWDPFAGMCTDAGGGHGSTRHHNPLVAGLILGMGSTLLLTTVGILLCQWHWRIQEAQERLAKERKVFLNTNNGGKLAKIFTGKEIKKATNNFSKDRLLGSGGYGEVFKGILDDGTDTVIAVKCAKLGIAKGTDQVLNEARILCQVNHRSLVRLLGCCVDLAQPIMVYEYIPNGTLFEHLQGLRPNGGRNSLDWNRRLNIAQQTAEGLAYLHSSAVPPIYHRDVKSSNILLDEKLKAKVSDFGLSRLVQTDVSHISTCAQGTLGYLDPEYYRSFQLTDKSDVYSFGVVLLELLTSQKAIDFNRDEDDVNLVVYAKRIMVEEGRLMDVVDPMLKEKASRVELEMIKALGFLAASCLEERGQNRPSMKQVAEEISYIMGIVTAE